jgi:3-O-alpha-D-mannopyranosyl-alpha-D-mannopyranose xylosylphosphotransferase
MATSLRDPTRMSNQPSSCELSINDCLPSDSFTKPGQSHSAIDIFTHLAFAMPGCGDCLIDALVTASGRRGLSAVLPTEDQVFYPPEKEGRMWERSEPMLPMTDRWEDADFSVHNVVRPGQDVWAGREAREEWRCIVARWEYQAVVQIPLHLR